MMCLYPNVNVVVEKNNTHDYRITTSARINYVNLVQTHINLAVPEM